MTPRRSEHNRQTLMFSFDYTLVVTIRQLLFAISTKFYTYRRSGYYHPSLRQMMPDFHYDRQGQFFLIIMRRQQPFFSQDLLHWMYCLFIVLYRSPFKAPDDTRGKSDTVLRNPCFGYISATTDVFKINLISCCNGIIARCSLHHPTTVGTKHLRPPI